MNHSSKIEKSQDDELFFADENEDVTPPIAKRDAWKILIADDEQEVHSVTGMVLEDYIFEYRTLELLHAYSGREAKEMIRQNTDIAIILLDVVMESDDSGLDVVRYIREDLKNYFIRIILRTGQPGKAPEREIITTFDINDYKEKTELTAQKLFTTITSSLRSYRDLRTIEKNRKGLELIINSAGHLFAQQRLKKFTEGVLTQLSSLLRVNEDSLFLQASGFAASDDKENLTIIAATGKFEKFINQPVTQVLPDDIQHYVRKAITSEESLFVEDVFIGFFKTESGTKNLIFLDGCINLTNLDKDLIRIFSNNVGVAFDNIYLNREIIETQKEVIETLGGIVDTRCHETANHVKRVAEYGYILALQAGVKEKKARLLKLASPMHDVGKIGIPDSILNKPDKLTEEEFEIVKNHTLIGYEILNKSRRQIIKTAAIVAFQHHERWDGKGYPNGLKGEEIHLYARIIGLVDVFDAVSNKRHYKDAWPLDRVLSHIKNERGKQFDPNLVDIFLENIDEFLEIKERFSD